MMQLHKGFSQNMSSRPGMAPQRCPTLVLRVQLLYPCIDQSLDIGYPGEETLCWARELSSPEQSSWRGSCKSTSSISISLQMKSFNPAGGSRWSRTETTTQSLSCNCLFPLIYKFLFSIYFFGYNLSFHQSENPMTVGRSLSCVYLHWLKWGSGHCGHSKS